MDSTNESKGSGGITSLLGNKQLIHIVCEIILICGIVYFFTRKNAVLTTAVQSLVQKIQEQEGRIVEIEKQPGGVDSSGFVDEKTFTGMATRVANLEGVIRKFSVGCSKLSEDLNQSHKRIAELETALSELREKCSRVSAPEEPSAKRLREPHVSAPVSAPEVSRVNVPENPAEKKRKEPIEPEQPRMPVPTQKSVGQLPSIDLLNLVNMDNENPFAGFMQIFPAPTDFPSRRPNSTSLEIIEEEPDIEDEIREDLEELQN